MYVTVFVNGVEAGGGTLISASWVLLSPDVLKGIRSGRLTGGAQLWQRGAHNVMGTLENRLRNLSVLCAPLVVICESYRHLWWPLKNL